MTKLNLQNVEYFLKVAESLNFSATASELFISQPALSKQIKLLEEAIGIQLFKRSTRQVELTEGGKIMYDAWTHIIRETDEAMAKAKKANAKFKKKIRIGLIEMGGFIDIIMPVLEKYVNSHEEIELEFATYGFTHLREKLKNKELDMIITLSSEVSKNAAKVSIKNLKRLDLFIIVPPKNHLYNKDELTVAELKDEEIYIFSGAYSDLAKKSIIEHCEREGFYPTKMKLYPNITSMVVALSTGDGVTIGYRPFFREAEGKLKFFPVNDETEPHYLSVAWRNNQERDVEDLVAYLENR